MKTAFCFDLDGTITKDEILPLLSKKIDLFEEISALTDATIKGIIPFQKSFLLRCRLLQEIPISTVQEIVSGVRVYSQVVDFIAANRENCFVITGNLDAWVAPFASILGCRCFCSEALVEDDRLVKVERVLNKGDAVKIIREDYDKIVAIGDGMGDVHMFTHSDVCIAYGGTHMPVQTLQQMSNFLTFDENSLCSLLNTLL